MSKYDGIKTAAELVREVKNHGLSTVQEDLNRAAASMTTGPRTAPCFPASGCRLRLAAPPAMSGRPTERRRNHGYV